VVATWHLAYLVKTDMAELASFLLVDLVDGYHELTVTVPPTILLAFYLPIVVLSLIYGIGLRRTLVFAEDCMDGLLIGGVTCC
jgi:hypothetical protein